MNRKEAASVATQITASQLDLPDDFGTEWSCAYLVVAGNAAKAPSQGELALRNGRLVHLGPHACLIFRVPAPTLESSGEDFDCHSTLVQEADTQLGLAFEQLDAALGLSSAFMEGNDANWYPLVVAQVPHVQDVDYRPFMFVDFNLSYVRFAGKAPPRTRLLETVCRGLLQWTVMEAALDRSRATLEIAESTSRRTLDKYRQNLTLARHNLLYAIVSCDTRIGCYQFLDFAFADKIRSAWQLQTLESMAGWSLSACSERLQSLRDAQQERGRQALRVVLAVLTVASALTAILTVVEFSTSDLPLAAESVGRVVTAVCVVGLAAIVGVQLHRKGLG